MASGKRASMREGPLAALFRRTDEAGDLTQDPAAPDEAPRAKQRPQPAEERAPEVAPRASRAQRAPREPAESRKPASRKAPERKPAPESEEAPAPSASTAAGQRREREYPHPGLGSRDELPTDRPRIPTPQERLRHAFSSEIPDNIMEPPRREPAPEAPRPAAPAPRDPFAHGDHDPNWGEAKAVGQPVLRVVGVGGAGVNAVNRMVEAEVVGVEFIAINTDVQSLQQSTADITLHIGPQVTRGLGAGSDPDLGRAAAMEEYDKIKALLKGADMVFIAAGSGGGTGTGAAPIVARIAREIGALAVGIVTKPFGFEGSRRAAAADVGIRALGEEVDTLIVVPNNRLLSVLDKQTSMVDAFRVADDVLRQGVQGISDLVTLPGLINLDFADVRTIMADAGDALLGIGMGVGETRALDAAQAAVSSPLLETSMEGARKILLSITAGDDLSLWEVNEAAKAVAEAAHPEANIIFGAMVDERLEDQVWVTVVATGYTDAAPRRITRPPLEEPAGEPRVQRRTDSGRDREPEPARSGATPRRSSLGVTELDVPEFIPRG
jgi:cell division protein FtsZ